MLKSVLQDLFQCFIDIFRSGGIFFAQKGSHMPHVRTAFYLLSEPAGINQWGEARSHFHTPDTTLRQGGKGRKETKMGGKQFTTQRAWTDPGAPTSTFDATDK